MLVFKFMLILDCCTIIYVMQTNKLVLVTGVFDILHAEHIKLLTKAKSLGQRLLVAIESDARVKRIKGEARPVNSQLVRQRNLANLKIADEVIILPEKFDDPQDHRQFLLKIRPDILAVSAHTTHLEEKQRLMAEIGGVVMVILPYNPNISSTKIIASKYKNIRILNKNVRIMC